MVSGMWKINSIMTSIAYFHLQYCHIPTDRVYASAHKKGFHRDDIFDIFADCNHNKQSAQYWWSFS